MLALHAKRGVGGVPFFLPNHGVLQSVPGNSPQTQALPVQAMLAVLALHAKKGVAGVPFFLPNHGMLQSVPGDSPQTRALPVQAMLAVLAMHALHAKGGGGGCPFSPEKPKGASSGSSFPMMSVRYFSMDGCGGDHSRAQRWIRPGLSLPFPGTAAPASKHPSIFRTYRRSQRRSQRDEIRSACEAPLKPDWAAQIRQLCGGHLPSPVPETEPRKAARPIPAR